uniref:LP-Fur-6 n=1 Tax=Furina ornata TaxID=529697 RepID=R4FIG0_9SAUR
MARFISLSLGLLVVALSLRGTVANPQCPYEWSFFNGYCYKVFKQLKSWRDAEMSCRRQEEGSHLASIQSSAESSYVARLISRNVFFINVWIGLSDPERRGIWKWSDGSRFLYKSWKKGEPNNFLGNQYCVELWSLSGYLSWNDKNCWSKLYFICKFQPQDEGSTW